MQLLWNSQLTVALGAVYRLVSNAFTVLHRFLIWRGHLLDLEAESSCEMGCV